MLSTFTNTGVVPADERAGVSPSGGLQKSAKAGTPAQQPMWSPGSPGERILEAYDRLKEAVRLLAKIFEILDARGMKVPT